MINSSRYPYFTFLNITLLQLILRDSLLGNDAIQCLSELRIAYFEALYKYNEDVVRMDRLHLEVGKIFRFILDELQSHQNPVTFGFGKNLVLQSVHSLLGILHTLKNGRIGESNGNTVNPSKVSRDKYIFPCNDETSIYPY